MIARKRVKVGKYWTYMTDPDKEKFLKFTKAQADKMLKELKAKKGHMYKIVPVQQN